MAAGTSHNGGDGLRNEGLAFFGAVTASVSHELNNVISIIDQTAGLIEDMIAGEEKGVPLSVERLAQAAVSIRKQTERGLHIIRRLNRFAHSADHAVVEYDVNEVIGNLVDLSRRLADLKRVRIDAKPYFSPLKVIGNPFSLQQMVFGIFQILFSVVQRDDTIRVEMEAGQSGAVVTVTTCCRPVTVDEDRLEVLKSLADGAGGQLVITPGDTGTEFRLAVPDRPPSDDG